MHNVATRTPKVSKELPTYHKTSVLYRTYSVVHNTQGRTFHNMIRMISEVARIQPQSITSLPYLKKVDVDKCTARSSTTALLSQIGGTVNVDCECVTLKIVV